MSFNFSSGNTGANTASTGFNFGSTSNTSSSGGGFNFGNASSNTQQSNTSTGGTSGGFNFGNTNNTTTGGTGSSGFNFGNTSSNTTSTGGTGGGFNFGNTNNTSGGTSGSGFNFGNTSSNTSGGNTTGGGFNFGNTNTTSGGTGSSGFNFGSTSSNTTSGSSGFNFGNTSTTGNKPASSTGAFNFGSTTTNTGGNTFNFGAPSTTSTNPLASGGGTVWQVQNTQMQLVQSEIQKINHAYNVSSPYCRFMFWLYNAADPSQKPLYEQKIAEQYKNIIHPRKFQEARNGNPDPRRFYPVPVRSFDDLTKRVEKQNERTEQFKSMLISLEKRIEALRRHHEVTTIPNIKQVKENYRKLYSRVLRLMSLLEVLYQRGVGVGSSDIALKTKLQNLQRELQKPNQYRGRLNELIPQVNYHIQNSASLHAPPINEDMIGGDTEKQIKEFFEEQTRGLKQLLKILKKDTEDINLIQSKLGSIKDG